MLFQLAAAPVQRLDMTRKRSTLNIFFLTGEQRGETALPSVNPHLEQ